MKKKLQFRLLYFVFLLYSCNKNESPRPIAEKFITAFQQHDFDEAAKYSTKETAKMLKQLQRMEELEKIKPMVSNAKIEILTEEIAGNKATVYFKEEGSETEEKLNLEKVIVDQEAKVKEWRVALSKTDVQLPKRFNGTAVPDSLPRQVF